MMTAYAALIDEVEQSISSSTVERRIERLRRVTDLFLVGVEHYSDDLIAVFDEVIGRLATGVGARARSELAERMVRTSSLPSTLPSTVVSNGARREAVLRRKLKPRSSPPGPVSAVPSRPCRRRSWSSNRSRG